MRVSTHAHRLFQRIGTGCGAHRVGAFRGRTAWVALGLAVLPLAAQGQTHDDPIVGDRVEVHAFTVGNRGYQFGRAYWMMEGGSGYGRGGGLFRNRGNQTEVRDAAEKD
jgi:hypothetical protein